MGRHSKNHQSLYFIRMRNKDGSIRKEYIFENGKVHKLDSPYLKNEGIKKENEPVHHDEEFPRVPASPPVFPQPIPKYIDSPSSDILFPHISLKNVVYLSGERITDYFLL